MGPLLQAKSFHIDLPKGIFVRGVALLELFHASLFGVLGTSHQMIAIKKVLLRNINMVLTLLLYWAESKRG